MSWRIVYTKQAQKDAKKLAAFGLKKKHSNSAKVVQLMAHIAERGTAFREIDDPAVWQREIRQDRPLPGRDNS